MSDKKKSTQTTKAVKPKPSSLASASSSSSSRVKVASTTVKERQGNASRLKTKCQKFNLNASVIGDVDAAAMQRSRDPEYDAECRQIAYGIFLRAMLEDILVDEKIEREDTEMDVQMAQLSDRFHKTTDILDKTNRRIKDVSFVVEQKRLLDLKSNDSARFCEMTDTSNAQELLHNLNVTEQACLNKLETNNVDFGFDKDSGHKQLLDAVTDAIEGLKEVKSHSNIDTHKFEEYEKSQKTLEDLEKQRLEIGLLKTDFEQKFPLLNEKLLTEASEKIAHLFDNEIDE